MTVSAKTSGASVLWPVGSSVAPEVERSGLRFVYSIKYTPAATMMTTLPLGCESSFDIASSDDDEYTTATHTKSRSAESEFDMWKKKKHKSTEEQKRRDVLEVDEINRMSKQTDVALRQRALEKEVDELRWMHVARQREMERMGFSACFEKADKRARKLWTSAKQIRKKARFMPSLPVFMKDEYDSFLDQQHDILDTSKIKKRGRGPAKSKKKDPNRKKRSCTAYNFFAKEMAIVVINEGVPVPDRYKRIGAMWRMQKTKPNGTDKWDALATEAKAARVAEEESNSHAVDKGVGVAEETNKEMTVGVAEDKPGDTTDDATDEKESGSA